MEDSVGADGRERTSPAAGWAVLAVASVAQFMVIIDVTVVNVALPAMRDSLGMSASGQQWVVNAYALAFGGFLLAGARAADLLGRRRIFACGLLIFTLSSLVGGFAENESQLIAARAVEGFGAALLAPATLSLITTTYLDVRSRSTAIMVLTAAASSGQPFGVVLGGLLTDGLGWRWVLFVNVPIGVLLFAATLRYLPTSRGQFSGIRSIDLLGAALVTCGVTVLVYAIVGTENEPWGSGRTIGQLVAAAILLIAFVAWQTRASHPLVPLGIFRNRLISSVNVIMMLIATALTAFFFLISLYLQQVNGYSAIRCGLAILPTSLAALAGTLLSRPVATRFGYRVTLVMGTLVMALGLLGLSRLSAGDGYAIHFLVPAMLGGLGFGLCVTPITVSATSGVEISQAGLASGLINASRQVGGALGLAVVITVANSRTEAYLDDHPDGGLAALAAGYDRGFLLAALMLLTVAVISAVSMPRVGAPRLDVRSPAGARPPSELADT